MKNCLRVGQKLSNEFNFLHPKVSDKDIELFGFTDAPNCFHKEDVSIIAHVMHMAGIFPSVGIARKNGWDKPIPPNMSEFTVGKAKKKVWILNEIKGL